ncbi:MAG: ribosomal protein S18-alanine N-acetyltransferase [Chloroflexi bacterium]|nr:ribosomal protein S18-alanine N-acetyltransferase [Chloroflexota bacterium]MBI3764046.1 ribosomal protein S18-alanine N-acetyltransferase [Chloroflexota bacterium]
MELADVPQVAAIDRQSFPLPWLASSYRHELTENENAHFLVAHLGPVSRRPGQWWQDWFRPQPVRTIVGYGGYWYIMDEAHISTIAVHPDYRGQGIGERLLVAMLEHARSLGATLATLEVRVGNVVAQNLYRKYGFEEVGRRNGYYRDNGEDALLMTVAPLAKVWESMATQGADNRR